MKVAERIILGIDPGTIVMGYGLIKVQGNRHSFVDAGCIRLNKICDHALRLKHIHEGIQDLIDRFLPDEMAIEAPFHGKNVQSMLKLGRAQGVAIGAAIARDIPFQEYAPRRIKQAVTGNGAASKEQVAAMVIRSLQLDTEVALPLDASDGLAAALCHAFTEGRGNMGSNPKQKGWGAFIASNPGRVSS